MVRLVGTDDVLSNDTSDALSSSASPTSMLMMIRHHYYCHLMTLVRMSGVSMMLCITSNDYALLLLRMIMFIVASNQQA